MTVPAIDSATVGDPTTFLSLTSLCERFAAAAPSPRARGRVALLVRRLEGGRREEPREVRLTADRGMPGDAWFRKKPDQLDAQLTAVQHAVGVLIANGQPLALFGDSLFFDLDLSAANLPVGSRLRVGAALLEVTPKPHRGCAKFSGRFGPDALRFVAHPERRPFNLRGIYLRVVEDGAVAVGDPVEVLSRASGRPFA
jgi:hypothetical protein